MPLELKLPLSNPERPQKIRDKTDWTKSEAVLFVQLIITYSQFFSSATDSSLSTLGPYHAALAFFSGLHAYHTASYLYLGQLKPWQNHF